MRVGLEPVEDGFLARLRLPHLRPCQEEALVAGQAVDHRRFLAFEAQLVGGVGHRQAAQIADVLAHRQLTVHALAFQRAIRGVLRAQRPGAGLEARAVLVGPPVALDAGGIRLRALVVEAVAHFVADHAADSAVVHRRIGAHVEERRLQDAGREHDLVERRVVVGVDRMRGHEPFVAVGPGAEAAILVVDEIAAQRLHVRDQVAGHDLHAAVIAPFPGVADLRQKRAQFLVGLGLGRIAHPVEGFDVLAQRGAQVLDQIVHRRLGFGLEVPGHVDPADRIAQSAAAADGGDAALPQFALGLLALQHGAGECERRLVDVGAEHRRVIAHGVIGQIVAPYVERCFRNHLSQDRADRARRGNIHLGRRLQALGGEMRGPVIAGEFLAQLGEGAQVVGLVAVAQLGAIPHPLRQLGFQCDDRLGAWSGVGDASEAEHGGDVVEVGGADLDEAGFRVDVEILVGQAQAAHADADQIAVGVLAVERHAAAHRTAGAVDAGAAERGGQRGDGVDAGDPRQGRLQRCDTGGIARRGVHVAGVEVADFLFVAAGLQILARLQFLDDRVDLFLGLIAQCVERTEAGVVIAELIVVEPAAVGVAVEIVAGLHRQVAIAQVDAETAQLRLGGGAGGVASESRGRGECEREAQGEEGLVH